MKHLIKGIKKKLSDMDKPLLFMCIGLFAYGLLNIVTASSNEAVVRQGVSLYYYFIKQIEILLIGTILTIVLINIPTKKYPIWAPIIFIGIIVILLYLTFEGDYHRGSKNWIRLPFVGTFQPSEFAKPIIIVCLSLMFTNYYRKLRTKGIPHYDMIGKILIVGLFIPIIVFFQGDLGTCFIMITIFGVLFLASPILRMEKFKVIIFVLIVGIVGCGLKVTLDGYLLSDAQLSRFDYINPCSNYEQGGYQICNSFIAINDGGLLGLGIGKSKQKYSYIPEPHTDSVFAIIVEENGLLRVTIIFVLYILILKRILNIASKTNSLPGRYMCLGFATYILAHIFVNLGGLFGLIPLTGVPLPFLSYGGTFTLSLIASLAIIQRINIETNNEKVKLK